MSLNSQRATILPYALVFPLQDQKYTSCTDNRNSRWVLCATHRGMYFMLSFHPHNHSMWWVHTIIPIFINDKTEA